MWFNPGKGCDRVPFVLSRTGIDAEGVRYPNQKVRREFCAYEHDTCDVCIDCQNAFVEYGERKAEARIVQVITTRRQSAGIDDWPLYDDLLAAIKGDNND